MKLFLKRNISQLLNSISPKLNIWLTFNIHYNYYKKILSFKNPISLDEKIQWMKVHLYDKNPLVSQCADKYLVREYVAEKGCAEILNELIGAYERPNEIPWDEFPNKFVIKWNFGAGLNIICNDKSKLDREAVIEQLLKWRKLHKSFYKSDSELQYKLIEPKIICEKFIETEDKLLPVDYKVYCFNGKPHCTMVSLGRGTVNKRFYFVDKDWNLLRYNKSGQQAPVDFFLPKPKGYEKLFYYAEILSKPFPFVRADFYLENGNVIFGELTFTPSGGKDPNILIEKNVMLGAMVDLNYNSNKAVI